MYSRWLRNSFIYLLILVAVIAIVFAFFNERQRPSTIGFGDVIQDAKDGEIQKIEVDGTRSDGHLQSTGQEASTSSRPPRSVRNTDLEKVLADQGVALSRTDAPAGTPAVDLEYKDSSGFGPWLGLLLNLLPFLLFGLFLLLIMRQAQGSNSQAMSFGKSRARLFTGSKVTVTFADVAGVDEAKEELAEVVEFLKYPEKFAALGARIPKGVLLVGPPGTGKTLLSRAVAGEAGVPFFSISGSEFVEMFVGVGASRVRDLFDQAKKNAPCIVFVDEIDAVGRQRGAGLGGSHDEREQTLNQILVEMDGFDTGTNVIVIAATNRPDILDPALLRPGRFDRKVILDAPDVKGREAILDVHAKGKPIADDVALSDAREVDARLQRRRPREPRERGRHPGRPPQQEDHHDERVRGGGRPRHRRPRAQEPGDERRTRRSVTAYHEGGHTVVAPLHGAPRPAPQGDDRLARHGRAATPASCPTRSRTTARRSMFRDQLCTALGGHAAEELVFGEASTGPSNDIEQVTRIARAMVTRWGMSERLGPRTFGRSEEMVFLGREISETRNYSEKIAEEIDDEVRRLIEEAQERARNILREHRDLLDKLATVLLEVETLEGETLTRLLNSDPNDPWPPRTCEAKRDETAIAPPATPKSRRRAHLRAQARAGRSRLGRRKPGTPGQRLNWSDRLE